MRKSGEYAGYIRSKIKDQPADLCDEASHPIEGPKSRSKRSTASTIIFRQPCDVSRVNRSRNRCLGSVRIRRHCLRICIARWKRPKNPRCTVQKDRGRLIRERRLPLRSTSRCQRLDDEPYQATKKRHGASSSRCFYYGCSPTRTKSCYSPSMWLTGIPMLPERLSKFVLLNPNGPSVPVHIMRSIHGSRHMTNSDHTFRMTHSDVTIFSSDEEKGSNFKKIGPIFIKWATVWYFVESMRIHVSPQFWYQWS